MKFSKLFCSLQRTLHFLAKKSENNFHQSISKCNGATGGKVQAKKIPRDAMFFDVCQDLYIQIL